MSGSTVTAGETYDVIIVGGGHNGLVCGAYLAKAGLKVCIAEKRSVVGGAAVTEEFHPGFKNSVYSYAVSLLNPKIIADLDLAGHGLSMIPLDRNGYKRFVPVDDGDYLALPVDLEASAAVVDQRHKGDGKSLLELTRRIGLAADALRSVVLDTPPNINGGFSSVVQALMTGNKLRKLDAVGRVELIKLMTMSVGDYLNEWFEGDAIKGLYGYSAAVGNMQSPFMAGSAYVLLHHVFGEVNGRRGRWGQAIGGMGAITQAMAKSAQAAGATIVTGRGISEITVNRDGANGVVFTDGTVARARAVVSNLNPRLLFTTMVDSAYLPDDYLRRMQNWRCISGVFRMNVALAELPKYTSTPDNNPQSYIAHSVVTAPSLDYLDRAYDDAKHGRWSNKPIVELQIPSLNDPSMAPAGQHVASMFCQYFHPNLADGMSWDVMAPKIADHIIDHYTTYAPNFKSSIIARQIKSPLDLERDLGLVGGDIFHGALHLDQIFSMRPAPDYADYRTPIRRLYLCGSGAHPGGGVTGVPGHNAAREILRDFKRRRVG